jgi:HlyD family secretion protein
MKSSIFYFVMFAVALTGLTACNRTDSKADAYGNFETDDRIVGAEGSGRILSLRVEEGQTLKVGEDVGRIDSIQLILKKEQLQASIRAVAAKSPDISAQLAVFEKQVAAYNQQLTTLRREKLRVENLLKNDAATSKQLDDLNAQIDQVQRQMDVVYGQKSASDANLTTQKGGLLAEILPLQKQIAQLDDQIAKCHITNTIDGTVLVKYAEPGEITSFGKPLYKIADLKNMILRAYLTGDQLGSIKVGQTVRVSIDGPNKTMKDFTGTITWVSQKAEFTPKIIQTKDERVNLVYAMKISVPSDGTLKIGMPAEVKWTADGGR